MRNVFGIARRELSTYFNSPIAYIVLGVFLAVGGGLFFFLPGPFAYGRASVRGFFELAPLLFMIFTPAVTMRLIAEERKSGTIELLLTLPVQDWEVVVGKFVAALGMLALGILFTFAYPLSLSALVAEGSHFDWGPAFGGYLACLFLASAFIAVGMWASAMSKNQIVGFLVGLVICFLLWLPDKANYVLPPAFASPLQNLSVQYHFMNIARGVVDLRDVLYYVTVTTIGLMLTTRSLAATRQ